MFRSVNYSSSDMYCRYLDASLCHTYWSGVSGGRFGNYLKDKFALEKLPYDIKLQQLIVTGVFLPNLLVKLPISYFKKWVNFPECPASWKSEKNEEEKAAGHYNIYCRHSGNLSFDELLHPYDSDPLRESFVERFKTEAPKCLRSVRASKNREFLPFEAYFAYWRGYVLAEALTGYLDVERFLPRNRGVTYLLKRISSVGSRWGETYGDTFNRLSMYRTATSILYSGHGKTDLTFQDVSNFLLSKNGATAETLENDLNKLLILYLKWNNQIQRNGAANLRLPLELLRQDIYHLFEWLCTITDKGEMYYFDKWSYKTRCGKEWAQLEDVISYEVFEFKKNFLKFIKYYCEEIQGYGYAHDLDAVYNRLCQINSFSPWMRSFTDMHKSINKKGIIDFKEPRIIDYLIVMTTRTEIVIRSMFDKYCSKECPSDLSKLFRELSTQVKNKCDSKTLGCLHNDWASTNLKDKPDDIFSRIECHTE